jgi:hypothetical protein
MAKALPFGKHFSFMVQLFTLCKTFYFMVKFLPRGKTILLHGQTSPSWQNLSLPWLNLSILAKPFSSLVKPLLFGKSFFLG